MRNKLLIVLTIIALVACVLLVVGCSNTTEYQQGDFVTDNKDVEYEIGPNGEITIHYTGKIYDIKYLVGDSAYVTLEGTKLSELFITGYQGEIKSLSLQDIESRIIVDKQRVSLAGIKDYAFAGCETLETVNLTKATPSLDFNIGTYAFANCVNLEQVTFPTQSVYTNTNTIGAYAFLGNEKLSIITIPDNFSRIATGAFKNCTSLSTVNLSEKVTVFSDYVFDSCTQLSSINYSNKVKSIGDYAFRNTNFYEFEFNSGIRYIGEGAFFNAGLNKLNIPSNVTYIGNSAFVNNNFDSITIPFIGNSMQQPTAFSNIYSNAEDSYNYYDLIVTNSRDIDSSVFEANDDLASIKLTFAQEGNYPIYSKDGMSYENYYIEVDNTVGSRAFYGCESLTEVDIEGIKSIGDSAFEGCSHLSSFPGLEEGLVSLGNNAYKGCSCAETATLPSSITEIGSAVFAECGSLQTLTVNSFRIGYTNIDIIDLFGIEEVSENTYYFANGRYLPKSLWSVTLHKVYSLPDSIFSGWEHLESVTINASTDYYDNYSIGDRAFYNCQSLETIVINDTFDKYKSIGTEAFYGCSSLNSIDLPQVETIGDKAFAYCTNLTSIELPNTVTSYGDQMFYNCNRLSELTFNNDDFGSSMTKYFGAINAYGDENYNESWDSEIYSEVNGVLVPDSLTTINLNGVVSVEDSILRYFNSVTTINVTFKDSYQYYSVGNYAFADCEALVNVNFVTDKEVTFGNNVFYNCDSLQELTLPKLDYYTLAVLQGNNSIHTLTLTDCNKTISQLYGGNISVTLKNIHLDQSITHINSEMFKNCTNVENITFGDNVTSIGENAFDGCDSLSATRYNVVIYNNWIVDLLDDTQQNVYIPSGVTSFANGLFYNNQVVYFGGNQQEWESINLADNTFGEIKFIDYELVTVDNVLYGIVDGSAHAIASDNNSKVERFADYVTINDQQYDVTTISSLYYNGKATIVVIPATLITVEDGATMSSLTNVYYKGTEEQWSNSLASYSMFLDKTVEYNFAQTEEYTFNYYIDYELVYTEQSTFATGYNAPHKDGYVFLGWSTTSYNQQDNLVEMPYLGSQDQDFYACYDKLELTITEAGFNLEDDIYTSSNNNVAVSWYASAEYECKVTLLYKKSSTYGTMSIKKTSTDGATTTLESFNYKPNYTEIIIDLKKGEQIYISASTNYAYSLNISIKIDNVQWLVSDNI